MPLVVTEYPLTPSSHMSCNSLRSEIVDALRADAEGKIAKYRMNVEVYLHNPVGIGEHPDVLSAIQEQLDRIAEETERIEVINRYFAEVPTTMTV